MNPTQYRPPHHQLFGPGPQFKQSQAQLFLDLKRNMKTDDYRRTALDPPWHLQPEQFHSIVQSKWQRSGLMCKHFDSHGHATYELMQTAKLLYSQPEIQNQTIQVLEEAIALFDKISDNMVQRVWKDAPVESAGLVITRYATVFAAALSPMLYKNNRKLVIPWLYKQKITIPYKDRISFTIAPSADIEKPEDDRFTPQVFDPPDPKFRYGVKIDFNFTLEEAHSFRVNNLFETKDEYRHRTMRWVDE